MKSALLTVLCLGLSSVPVLCVDLTLTGTTSAPTVTKISKKDVRKGQFIDIEGTGFTKESTVNFKIVEFNGQASRPTWLPESLKAKDIIVKDDKHIKVVMPEIPVPEEEKVDKATWTLKADVIVTTDYGKSLPTKDTQIKYLEWNEK